MVLIGAYGFCFGAKKRSEGAHLGLFGAMALIHPSGFRAEDADEIDVPVALLLSGGEDGEIMDRFWKRMRAKGVGEKCVRRECLKMFC